MAKIVTIKAVHELPKYDRIVLLEFNEIGEKVIAQKDYKVGDSTIFVEADSVLPVTPEFEFLRSRCYREKYNGFLIKPMKMAGVISMGIVFPMSLLGNKTYKPLTDVSDKLKIRKKEDIDITQTNKDGVVMKFLKRFAIVRYILNKLKTRVDGGFPTHLISKSDETTIQNAPQILEQYKNVSCVTTVKMEGQSVTALCVPDSKQAPGKFLICSRNIAYSDEKGNSVLWAFALKFDLENKIRNYYKEHGVVLAVQGERCAPGLQKNIYNFNGDRFFVFKIRDLTNKCDLSYHEMLKVCERLDLQHVPVIYEKIGYLGDLYPDVESCEKMEVSFIDFEKAPYQFAPSKGSKYHEGVVVRGFNNEFSFKIKNKEYQMWFNKDE